MLSLLQMQPPQMLPPSLPPPPLLLLLLLLLQIIAFCLYSAPLYYMCEKALRVHTKPIYIRVLARLPVCE